MPGLPTVDDVRAWCQIARTSMTDAQLQQVVDAEVEQQVEYCRVPVLDDGLGNVTVDYSSWPASLCQALYRRAGRVAAGRGVPLGFVGDPASEAGALRLATFDAEVERLEGPLRLVVFG